jgi:hypothetical protein
LKRPAKLGVYGGNSLRNKQGIFCAGLGNLETATSEFCRGRDISAASSFLVGHRRRIGRNFDVVAGTAKWVGTAQMLLVVTSCSDLKTSQLTYIDVDGFAACPKS